ncbi:MipA/OmpV family protein [Paraburkholderia youngii]|uniref:MipA/OmpV family protein n=1 Tax=Paraburkholderia youngii TaxID=2782701 RepID=UPI003D20EE2B
MPPTDSTSTSNWKVTVGATAIVQPRYPGADTRRIQPWPAFDIEYRNRIFFRDDEPLGVYIVNNAQWNAGLSVQYDLNQRLEKDDSKLHGMGNVPMTPRAKLFAQYSFAPFAVAASAAQDIGGHHEGLIGNLNATGTLPLGNRLSISTGPGVDWMSGQYARTFYGVNSGQSDASGLPQYAAHAGVQDVYFGVDAIYQLDAHWAIGGSVRLLRLEGSAANGPVTARKTQDIESVSVTYTF